MMTVRVIILCVSAALVCVLLRQYRPEIAVMVSLAVGLGVLLLAEDSLEKIATDIRRLFMLVPMQSESVSVLMKAAGISILSELGVQICCDAGEHALAGRIKLGCRIAMLMLAMPGLTGILDAVTEIAGSFSR